MNPFANRRRGTQRTDRSQAVATTTLRADRTTKTRSPIPPPLSTVPTTQQVPRELPTLLSGPSSSSLHSAESLPRSSSPMSLEEMDDEEEHDDRNCTVLRRGMPHHPYPLDQAPYMQSYSPASLDNDFYTFKLFQKLSGGLPSFHQYGRKPPLNVLDLGAGEGHWVFDTARKWRQTHVTGFDLIDVHLNQGGVVSSSLKAKALPHNVTWVRGNFITHELPFPDNTFDFVRMANLNLCIPRGSWGFVISEAKRVLQPGGRLELIDDALVFPAILPPLPRLQKRRALPKVRSLDGDSYKAGPVLSSSSHPSSPSSDPETFWEKELKKYCDKSRVSHHLEKVFLKMLVIKYGISPNPRKQIKDVLAAVFGHANRHEVHGFELAVPPREAFEKSYARSAVPPGEGSPDNGRKPKKDWSLLKPLKLHGLDSSLKDPRARSLSEPADPFEAYLRAKVAQILKGVARTSSTGIGVPYQPPGLVLLPGGLLEFSPSELEMHACKNLHILLDCKDTLIKYLEESCPGITEGCEDIFWDYERFRRARFHWPEEYPGVQMEETNGGPGESGVARPSPSRLASGANVNNTSPVRQTTQTPLSLKLVAECDMTNVRKIYVYHACKAISPSQAGF